VTEYKLVSEVSIFNGTNCIVLYILSSKVLLSRNLLFTFLFETDPVVGPSVCGGVAYGIRPVVAALPSWFRFAQCLRRYRDTRLAFPHLVNAGKYATTFFVVIFSTLHSIYKGTVCHISIGLRLS